ncbi:hypothetical protein CLU79DRAFT_271791 [Phycomyces nitens]|nr:hypothetical protein CLU79DRAFT_271791 [Phycomyces nitens]
MSRIGFRLWDLCVFTSSAVSASILEPLVRLVRVVLVYALQPRWSLLVRWLSSSSFRCLGSARRETFGCLLHDGYQALCSVVSKFPVIGFRSRISLFAGFSAAGSCLRGGIKCP